MKVSKKIFITSAVTGIAGIGLIGTSALAATSSSNSYPPIVQKLADTFHLNPADVQNVFKQERQDHEKDKQAKLKTKLDQAVRDGKITQDQEDKLIAELQKLHDQFKDGFQADRRRDHQKLHDQLLQWAKDNGINNLDDILPTPPAHPDPDHP